MLRESVAEDLMERRLDDGYLRPDYGGYSFLHVPATAAGVLGADLGGGLPTDVLEGVGTEVRNVAVVLLDGYGYRPWRRDHADHPFLRRLTRRGRVTPLTSIYPSETAAAITTMHTARPPADHGLLGWNAYLEETDERIETLPFTTDGEAPEAGPEALFAGDPIYGDLAEAGIDPHVIQPEGNVEGAYADRSIAGADRHGYWNVADYAHTLRTVLETAHADGGRNYVYAYSPTMDRVSHRSGTESASYRAQIAALSGALERELIDDLDPAVAEETLLLVTADHGHLNTVPDEGVDLREVPGVIEHLRAHHDGRAILPGGTPRNVHLFLEPGTAKEVKEAIESDLDALAFTKSEAIDQGLFGPGEPSERFRRRCGDVIVVHREREVWHGEEADVFEHTGVHGGLHPEEQLVPFAAARLDRLTT